jgi:hypothetical protein
LPEALRRLSGADHKPLRDVELQDPGVPLQRSFRIHGVHRGRRETLDMVGGRHGHDRVRGIRFYAHSA